MVFVKAVEGASHMTIWTKRFIYDSKPMNDWVVLKFQWYVRTSSGLQVLICLVYKESDLGNYIHWALAKKLLRNV